MADEGRVRICVHGRQRDDVGALHESRMTAVGRHDEKGGKPTAGVGLPPISSMRPS